MYGKVPRAALGSVQASLGRPTLDSTQVWQEYLSLQTGGISGANEVCAGLPSNKSPL